MRTAFSIGADENFSVADFAGLGGFDDRIHRCLHIAVRQHDFDFDLGQKIDGVFAAAINFGVALLAAKPFDLGDRHAFDAEARQSFFHFFEFERFDDGLDFFHVSRLLSQRRILTTESVPVNRNVEKFLRRKILRAEFFQIF